MRESSRQRETEEMENGCTGGRSGSIFQQVSSRVYSRPSTEQRERWGKYILVSYLANSEQRDRKEGRELD